MKLAFADAYRYVAEPRSDAVHAASRCSTTPTSPSARSLIDPKRAQDFGAGNPAKGGTIYLTAADERGMMVSFIQSNYMGFGSGVVVPGLGRLAAEPRPRLLLDPASPNVVAPGQAARSTPSSRRSSPRTASRR